MGKHKSSDLKFCSCRMCRYGRRKKYGNVIVLATRRAYRRKTKQLLKAGKYEDIPSAWSVVYTD